MKKIRTLLPLIFSLLSFLSFAQSDYRPGYIVKHNRDSINGFIVYRSNKKSSERCTFKETQATKGIDFSSEDLRAYGFHNDRRYESRSIPIDNSNTKVFLKVLAKGPLGLYRYKKFFFLDKDGLILLPKPEDKLTETKQGVMLQMDHQYIDILNSFLEGSELSANKTKYDELDLTNLINNYNRTKGQEPLQKTQKPATKINFHIFTGYVKSNMKMDLLQNVTFNPSSTITGGVGFDISSPRTFDKLFLSLEAWYIKAYYQAYFERIFSGDLMRTDMFVDISLVKIPVGFRYNFLSQTNTPYVKAGIAFYMIQSMDIRTLEETERINGIIVTEENYGEEYRTKNPRSFWVSVGYDKTIFQKVKGFAEFRVEKGNGFIGTTLQSFSSTVDLNFLIGIRF